MTNAEATEQAAPTAKKQRKPRGKAPAAGVDGVQVAKKPRKSRAKASSGAEGVETPVAKKPRKPRTKKAKEEAGDAVVAAVAETSVSEETKKIQLLLQKGEWSKADRRGLITNPKTGWTIFLNEQRMLDPSPTKKLCDKSKELAAVWRTMTETQKAPYITKSKADHERYDSEYNALSADEKKLLKNIKRQTKRERKEKSNAIGKVLSPFMLYSADKRKSVVEANPDAKVTVIASLIAKLWKAESAEVRDSYYRLREQQKAAVLKAVADAEAAEAAVGAAEDSAADVLLDKPVGFANGFSTSNGHLVGVSA